MFLYHVFMLCIVIQSQVLQTHYDNKQFHFFLFIKRQFSILRDLIAIYLVSKTLIVVLLFCITVDPECQTFSDVWF